ncbi:hypothetical protein PTSG_06430 [Salpingoeca rosetta]|uniref:Exostosin GT47 domain-containing protein n=1 Tax=Salpingoeca rosetta (strain ATCC 50818 / BSB-021) TaxID=946362 RepID=F2UFS6_SALR5|nr:uncharacterized protein PTSG_06430 [Salpingoeca rosetta]EGD75354.1 hypothetical protein PTSG_06430 [Salpingoeca rosetta]|eukprot:XP_004991811.1 hypothetical protein PTSG_06430 [Salpingoeca rosetta]
MCDTSHKHCQSAHRLATASKMHSAGHWQLAIGIGGGFASNGLIYGIPPCDTTPTTSVLIISPSTTTMTAATAAATAAVDDTTTMNSLQAAASAVDATMLSVPEVEWCEFHHCDSLDVSIPLFSMVTFIHSNRSSDAFHPHKQVWALPRLLALDAMRNHLPKLHNGRDIVLVCACQWFGKERMGREGEEEEFNKYTYTELALETKFGLIVEGFGYHSLRYHGCGRLPVIVVDHYVLPYQDLLDWETFSMRIPEHRLLELPRILRSIPDEVVEMIQRRVVFVFEDFFKSLSTHVHTGEGSARINLFGDNAGKMQVEGLAYGTPNDTPHDVMQESVWCNTPAHRRKAAKDNAPM